MNPTLRALNLLIYLGFFIIASNLQVIFAIIPSRHIVLESFSVRLGDMGIDLFHDLVVFPATDLPGNVPRHLQVRRQARVAVPESVGPDLR